MEGNDEAFERSGRQKMHVVVDTITAYLRSKAKLSKFQDVRDMGAALAAGDRLKLELLSGGNTNFSYKVSLEKTPGKAPVFAKLSMSKALGNSYTSMEYDLSRTENEFTIMNRFRSVLTNSNGNDSKKDLFRSVLTNSSNSSSNSNGNDSNEDHVPVVTPYFCVDAGPGHCLLVTAWSPADEQWANQFIDGQVDERVLEKLANTFAALHCTATAACMKDPDLLGPSFNRKIIPYMMTIFPLARSLGAEYLTDPNEKSDKGIALIQGMGKRIFHKIVDNMEKRYQERDCLVHGDAHPFNILVEPKPSIEELEKFGKEGSFVLCDWENAQMGPIGRDMGLLAAWPFACAFAHAVQGHGLVAHHIVGCMYSFWESYAAGLAEKGGKDEEFLKETYRDSLGWTGFSLVFIIHMLRLNCENLPLEGVPEFEQNKAYGSISYTGVKCLQWGFTDFDKDLSLDELNTKFMDMVAGEIYSLVEVSMLNKRRRGNTRRSSMLRESGKRVSDGYLHAEVAKRLAQLSVSQGTRKLGRRRPN
jgi:hypothetical protein